MAPIAEPVDKPQKKSRKRPRRWQKKNKNKARLVVRNLPFSTTEENLKEHFAKFGNVTDVKLLKKETGQLVGCGFVQFELTQNAAKARHHLNNKAFLDRQITCDWAVAKDKYAKQVPSVDIKEEPADGIDESTIKTEDEENESEVDDVNEVDEENEEEMKMEEDIKSEDESGSDDDVEEDDAIDDEEEDEDDPTDEEDVKDKPRLKSNDVVEGRTIFIKNAPFTATKKDLWETFVKFGPLYYALVCTDPFTEHSKGTAFVKFKNKEDADTCLTSEVTLMGHTLDCQVAVSKDQLSKLSDDKKNKNKQHDSRNLYLVKEGVILAGTKAAENVSAADMAKRLQLEQYKTQMLKNLHMFVARTRLIVHNLPETWDDAKLRALFVKYSSPGAVIKEARIMRNMRSVDHNGMGLTKGYGFVTFTMHEPALEALRAVNNNPKIFSPKKRPIVAFSIENRSKLKTKEKRLQNSITKNPNFKGQPAKKRKSGKLNRSEASVNNEVKTFAGVAAKLGSNKMRSRFNLRTQAQVHHEQLKKEKKIKKRRIAKKSLQERREDFTKQPRQKKNVKIEKRDSSSKLVDNYERKLLNVKKPVKKGRWYE